MTLHQGIIPLACSKRVGYGNFHAFIPVKLSNLVTTLTCSCVLMPLTLVCLTGAGFLLQAEGPRLTDEECPRSFGNHQTEPALDGHQPAYTQKMALTLLAT